MQDIIYDILKNADFSEGFIKYVENNFNEENIKKFNQPYEVDSVEDNPIASLDAEDRLWSTLLELVKLQKFYKDKGIPMQYFYDSIYDLSYRLERYYRNEGVYGLSERDIKWLAPMFRAEIFDLGSLRFQIFWFSNKEIERDGYDLMPLSDKWKKEFPEGTPVITIHILKDTDFRPHKIDEAFDLARDFFSKYFPEHDYKAFVCRTWLMYPDTRDILGDNSNIASFSKRFTIIAENRNIKQALDRIYGTNNLIEIEKMEKNSSLEEVAYKNIDKLGVAAGIIYK